MSGIQFAAPTTLRETGTISLTWDAVPPVDGKTPPSYTVQFLGLDGRSYKEITTTDTTVVVTGLMLGWTYNVHVWANGGDIAPQHASLLVHT